MRAPVLAFVLAAALQLNALAQGFGQQLGNDSRNPSVMQGLYTAITMPPDIRPGLMGKQADFSVTAVRGGNGSKTPLGCYVGPGLDLQFRSEYKDIDAQTMADWSYDLHSFVTASGGGWENYQRYQAQDAARATRPGDVLTDIAAEHGADAFDRAMLPYKKLADFAEHYWDTHNEKFKHLGSLWRSWWVHDSVLDGMNVYMEYQQRLSGTVPEDQQTTIIGFKDGTLAKLMRKQ